MHMPPTSAEEIQNAGTNPFRVGEFALPVKSLPRMVSKSLSKPETLGSKPFSTVMGIHETLNPSRVTYDLAK